MIKRDSKNKLDGVTFWQQVGIMKSLRTCILKLRINIFLTFLAININWNIKEIFITIMSPKNWKDMFYK
jgi:hypothetical protein